MFDAVFLHPVKRSLFFSLSVGFRLTLQKQLHWKLLPASRQDTANAKRAGAPCTLIHQYGLTDGQPSCLAEQT